MQLRKLGPKEKQLYLIQQGQGEKELKRDACLFHSFSKQVKETGGTMV